MANSIRVPVSKDVLVWARKQRGLQVHTAAKRLGLSENRLAQMEAGELNPTLTQLRNMSDTYRRPLIVLLLDEVPKTFQALTDYRSLSAASAQDYSPALLDEIRRAISQRDTYVELLKEMGETPPTRPLPRDHGNVAELAAEIRVMLGVTPELQRQWTRSEDAFSEWRSRVESIGVLVVETSRVELKEMRGFSIADARPYVIAVNGQDAARGKVFTLLHELAHLCNRHWGVCDLHQRQRRSDDLEVYCNAVAGEALLPLAVLRTTPAYGAHTPSAAWTDREIESIVQIAGGASADAVMRRLLQAGACSADEYERRHRDFVAEYEEFRKRRRSREKSGGPPPYRMQIRDRGKPFIRSVLDAYSDRIITLSDVSDLAGVRVKHLANLQREAYR